MNLLVASLLALACGVAPSTKTVKPPPPSPPRRIDVDLRSRRVQIEAGFELTVFEVASPAPLVEDWMGEGDAPPVSASTGRVVDPFGAVVWPGAVVAARVLSQRRASVAGATVLVLGVGTGLEALAAASLGAQRVVACDYNPLALALVSKAAQSAGLDQVLELLDFDVFSDDSLPGCEVLVCSDMLYDAALAEALGTRVREALTDACRLVVVTDSQRYGHGEAFLRGLGDDRDTRAEWTDVLVSQFTGSGLLLDDDQTYDATTRCLVLGADSEQRP